MMSGALLKQETDRVHDASDIVEVVGEYVHLCKIGSAGRSTGLCPFHQEKTASFNVNRTRQFYKCFGCGAGGDVFKFVMEIEGVSFVRAKALLAARAGVQLDSQRGTPAERRRYARAAAGGDAMALRLADFANGLMLVTEQQLSDLSSVLSDAVLDPGEALSNLHREVHLLHIATPHDIAARWRAMRLENLEAVSAIEKVGREHREDAARITDVIVELLATSERTGAA
jgi:hypothetical protein